MTTNYLARAIQALLQVLQGDYASGSVTLTATDADVDLNPHEPIFGIPVVNGCLDESRLVKVEPNPGVSSGAWIATSSGTDVLVTSVQGGPGVELEAETLIRWDPPITGLEPSYVAAGGVTGGSQATHAAALRQVRHYKDLGGFQAAVDYFQRQVAYYPAAVLAWEATTPADGSALPGIGPDATRLKRGVKLCAHHFTLALITSRRDGADARRREGDQLRDDVLELLTDRVSYRGCPLSLGRGIQILDARMLRASPTTYVDEVKFSCQFGLARRDDRTFNDWLTTRLQIEAPETVA